MKKQLFIMAAAAIVSVATKAQPATRFDFGEGKPAPGFVKITPETIYTHEKGFGFDESSTVYARRSSQQALAASDYISSTKPFYFSVKLPEGNYQVKVLLGDASGGSTTTIKAECRRLMVERAVTANGKFLTATFTVHLRDSLIRGANPGRVRLKPREREYFHWDDKLTLEFSNTAPRVCAVEISRLENIPVLFLAGNSTVVDQAQEPWAAWGQILPAFLQPGKIAVANYAESGETLKAFKGEKRLEKIWSLAKPGDYLFIEFAHNDQKPGGNYLEPFSGYKQALKEWIGEARARKMIPVLVTSMHRRSFDSVSGKIQNTLGDFPEAMRQAGKETGVTVIDLNDMSKTLYEAWGPDTSLKAFVHFPANTFPGQTVALKDNTHFTSYGAYELAKCIARGINDSKLPLRNFLVENVKNFDPSKPDPVAAFQLPSSTFRVPEKPDGN